MFWEAWRNEDSFSLTIQALIEATYIMCCFVIQDPFPKGLNVCERFDRWYQFRVEDRNSHTSAGDQETKLTHSSPHNTDNRPHNEIQIL